MKKQYVQGGLAGTTNLNGYFRSATVKFPKPYKTGTKPYVVATVRNYQNSAIDARLTTLVKNESPTSVQLFVADEEGAIATMGYEVMWMAIGEID